MRFTFNDSRFTPVASLALTLSALALTFWGFAQCDLPLALFLRSVHVPWLENVGSAGSLLGDGWILVTLSGTLLAIGLLFKWPRFRAVGWHSLIAHGLAGILVQMLKRLIGRPRPRFTHGDEVLLAPSLAPGFDSFPSGHTTASFAVAAVLARHFPRAAWAIYGVAGLVGVSRVVRGSHFPTDVAVGATVGLLLGLLVVNFIVNPLGVRWKALGLGLIGIAPYLAGFFALLWITIQSSPDTAFDRIAFAAGTLAVVWGAGSRLFRRLGCSSGKVRLPLASIAVSDGLIIVGLALSTGSLLVLLLGVLLSASRGLVNRSRSESGASVEEGPSPARGGSAVVYSEATLVVFLIVGLVLIRGLKGVLPLL